MSVATRKRIVVADDSGLMRRVVASALEREGFEVVGAAADGDEALALCQRHRPDAMTLDLAMPGLDGMGVLRALRNRTHPPATEVPVVVVSAFSPAHGARAVDALAEGAFDLVAKPAAGEALATFVTQLGDKVRAAAASSARPRAAARRAAVAHPRPVVRSATARAVVIASSTGGPRALAELMPRLPGRLGAGAVIVQHMPAGFTASLAQRLDRGSRLTIREANGGEPLDPTVALLAPGGSHLRLDGRRTRLSDAPPIGALRPRADLTITDVTEAFAERTLLVVLTGMGRDGLDGAREVKRRGGRVLVEAESSATVYGMPRAIAEAGLADAVLDLRDLPLAIAQEAGA